MIEEVLKTLRYEEDWDDEDDDEEEEDDDE